MSGEADELALEEAAQLSECLRRAQEGDESMLPVVRRLVQEAGVLERLGGDLAKSLETEAVQRIAGKNLLLREALLWKLELLRAELAGPDPPPVERLLADRVVLCWLHLHEAEAGDAGRGDGPSRRPTSTGAGSTACTGSTCRQSRR